MNNRTRAAGLIGLVSALALIASPVMASTGGATEVAGWQELLEYAKCALGVAAGVASGSPIGVAAAVVSCIYDAFFD
jgi:hypothetical protein